MKIKLLNGKPIIGLLLIIGVLFTSCIQRKRSKDKNNTEKQVKKNRDTVTISLNLEGKGKTGFNVSDQYLNNYSIEFQNNTNDTVNIVKHFPRVYKDMVLRYKAFIYKNGGLQKLEQSFLVCEIMDTLNLSFDNKKYMFKKNKYSIDDIYSNYENIESKIFKDKRKKINSLKQELDTLYSFYNKKYIDTNSTMFQLNKIYYFEKLQMLIPISDDVDFFFKEA